MDKQMKDRFAELLAADVSEVKDGYWLKLIATLLFYSLRISQ